MDVYVYKKKELQLSYFSICEGKKLDDKIVTYFALKAGSTVYALDIKFWVRWCTCSMLRMLLPYLLFLISIILF